jgi:hypothetical protein
MEKGSKDPSDKKSGGIITRETDCACEDEEGACCWHGNTPAQSEGHEWTDD